MKRLMVLLAFAMAPALARANESQAVVDEQLRIVVHPTVFLSGNWFAAGWLIGNAKTESPDNLNLLGGLGYRGKDWSTEVLVQRQFNSTRNLWFLGSRTYGRVRGLSYYNEFAPFLTGKGLYHQVIVERSVSFGSFGGEIENAYRPGRDSLGIGPRVSAPIKASKKFPNALAVSYQFRPNEPDALRVWLIVHPKF